MNSLYNMAVVQQRRLLFIIFMMSYSMSDFLRNTRIAAQAIGGAILVCKVLHNLLNPDAKSQGIILTYPLRCSFIKNVRKVHEETILATFSSVVLA